MADISESGIQSGSLKLRAWYQKDRHLVWVTVCIEELYPEIRTRWSGLREKFDYQPRIFLKSYSSGLETYLRAAS